MGPGFSVVGLIFYFIQKLKIIFLYFPLILLMKKQKLLDFEDFLNTYHFVRNKLF